MDLQGEIDVTCFFVEMAFGGVRIVGLELVEIAELVQAKQAQFPITRVVDLPFFERNFASDNSVPCSRVALELDATYLELLALVHINDQIHRLLLVVELGVRNRGEVDVAFSAVSFTQVLEALGNFFPAEDVPVFHREKAA